MPHTTYSRRYVSDAKGFADALGMATQPNSPIFRLTRISTPINLGKLSRDDF